MAPIPEMDTIWMDGALVPWERATVHVLSHALHYGSSVFEGIRVYATPDGPRFFRLTEDGAGNVWVNSDPPRVLVSPTYTGCPATVAIEVAIRKALDSAGFGNVLVERALFPPWTTDWITERGRQQLHDYGIAPPDPSATAQCPRCGSADTQEVSRFGATPCKAQWRCNACHEPFERFKCH